jgi:hypothetical protein
MDLYDTGLIAGTVPLGAHPARLGAQGTDEKFQVALRKYQEYARKVR